MKKKNLATMMMLSMLSAGSIALVQAADEVEAETPELEAEVIETEVAVEDMSTLSVGEEKVVQNIADDFAEFAGDDSQTLVEQLRSGEDFSYEVEVEQVVVDENGDPVMVEALDENGDPIIVEVTDANGDPVMVEAVDDNGNPILVEVTDANGDPVMVQALDENGEPMVDANGDPIMVQQTEVKMVQQTETVMVEQTELVMETMIVENSNGQMGFGEVSLTLGLAESLLGDGASYQDIADLLGGEAGILAMRADGMGWGEIFQSYDLKVGEVMRGVKSARSTQVASLERGSKRANFDKGGKAQAVGRPERLEKAARPERAEKVARPERPVRPEKVARPERPERPSRPERVARPERPEKPAKPERPGRG